jgi:hypothetical protein
MTARLAARAGSQISAWVSPRAPHCCLGVARRTFLSSRRTHGPHPDVRHGALRSRRRNRLRSIRVTPSGGGGDSRRAFTPGSGNRTAEYRERFWDPIVHVRGSIAVVWTPYEFWIDGKTSHCGIDVFDMMKEQGVWKIANMMWTVEPEACATLRPGDPTRIRPAR